MDPGPEGLPKHQNPGSAVFEGDERYGDSAG